MNKKLLISAIILLLVITGVVFFASQQIDNASVYRADTSDLPTTTVGTETELPQNI